ncbi:hypothetical protein P5673_005764 [Acropora cervicornis]|uniref:Uncharacterized protein n=1 Tax=Acropora cervicornis TaxID=6130 RepID=A0AAD9QYQ4_ACRCE|nr:hypothetical protein P5673_005764 [Acropora cervicornis]
MAKLFHDRKIKAAEKRKLDPPSESTIPAFYGLPKIHKPESIPLRPIVELKSKERLLRIVDQMKMGRQWRLKMLTGK